MRALLLLFTLASVHDACDPEERFAGAWRMSSTLVHSDLSICPRTGEVMSADRHGLQYQCGPEHTYFDASYEWAQPMPASTQLVAALHARRSPLRVAFVGDSTVQQVFFAFACELERGGGLNVSAWGVTGREYERRDEIKQPDGVSVSFRYSRFLRDNWPCMPGCANNTVETCKACDAGGAKRPESYDELLALNATVDALFISVGSWYNYHKGMYNSTAEYHHMLTHVQPALAALAAAGVAVYWYDIPHCGVYCMQFLRPEPAYEWERLAEKNTMARHLLGDAVTFLNASAAVIPRLQLDRVWPNGGPTDGLPHYCNPGPSSIPQFLVHNLLALLACRFVN